MRIETDYQKKLKIKQKQRAAFKRFIKGLGTPFNIREWIGLNYMETKVLVESRMLPEMSWHNYGTYWVVDHVAPFWIFDLEDTADLKLLWHPDNLMPMVWKDNNHKQGDLRFSVLWFSLLTGSSMTVEKLLARCQNELKHQDKYLIKKPLQ